MPAGRNPDPRQKRRQHVCRAQPQDASRGDRGTGVRPSASEGNLITAWGGAILGPGVEAQAQRRAHLCLCLCLAQDCLLWQKASAGSSCAAGSSSAGSSAAGSSARAPHRGLLSGAIAPQHRGAARVPVEALAPSRRPLPREDSDATGTAHDALLGTERSQGHRTSTLGCLDECQPGSGWHARCDCVAVAASHGCSADEATHHQKQVPRLPSKRARHFYPRR